MDKEKARKLLGLGTKFSKEELDQAYRGMRDVYYPPAHEVFGQLDRRWLQQIMYDRMRGKFDGFPAVSSENPEYGKFKAVYAYLHFADICEAYYILGGETEFNNRSVESPLDIVAYLEHKYGKARAKAMKRAEKFSPKTIWFLIPLGLAWIVALAGGGMAVGYIATAIFLWIHWGTAMRSMDGKYFLMYPLGQMWEGIKEGACHGLLLSKLISIWFCFWFFTIRGIVKMIFWPPSVRFDWEFNLTYENKEFAEFCRQQTAQRLVQTDAQIVLFSKEFDDEIIRKGAIGFAQFPYEAWNWDWRDKLTCGIYREILKRYPHIKRANDVASNLYQTAYMTMKWSKSDYDRAYNIANATAFFETPAGAIYDEDVARAQSNLVERIYGGMLEAGQHSVSVAKINKDVVDQRIMLNRCILRMEKPNYEDWEDK